MDQEQKKVVTRFAPSPTGMLHVGGARTALFNYIFAKQHKGKFILRVEDTDTSRSKKEYEEEILKDLEWLGIKYDNFYRQSDRKETYKKYIEKLLKEEKAFISKEDNDGKKGRKEVIRFKNPNKKIIFDDIIRKRVEFETKDLGDFVIAKSPEEPLYHLAVVVDDFEMGITHLIRAEEHISNTPRQILIQEALGIDPPQYAHLPLVLAPDRSKLKKREHGALASLKTYRDEEFLPEALVNFLAFLGWNPGDDKEIMSLEEIIKSFNLGKVQKGGAVFNKEKLEWINAQYLKKMPPNQIIKKIRKELEDNKKEGWVLNEEIVNNLSKVILERIKKWSDIKDIVKSGELDYFFDKPKLQKELIGWKKDNDNSDKVIGHLQKVLKIIDNLGEGEFNAKIIKERVMEYADKEGRGSVLWPIRYTLTGYEKSPDPFIISEILGKQETIKRWQEAIKVLKD